jgi:hypothetical protein
MISFSQLNIDSADPRRAIAFVKEQYVRVLDLGIRERSREADVQCKAIDTVRLCELDVLLPCLDAVGCGVADDDMGDDELWVRRLARVVADRSSSDIRCDQREQANKSKESTRHVEVRM